jgi:hypothetical protein
MTVIEAAVGESPAPETGTVVLLLATGPLVWRVRKRSKA